MATTEASVSHGELRCFKFAYYETLKQKETIVNISSKIDNLNESVNRLNTSLKSLDCSFSDKLKSLDCSFSDKLKSLDCSFSDKLNESVNRLNTSLKSLDCSFSSEKEKLAKNEDRILKISGNLVADIKKIKESIINEFVDEIDKLKKTVLTRISDGVKENSCQKCQGVFSNLTDEEKMLDDSNKFAVVEERKSP